jgi:hypothetical protein
VVRSPGHARARFPPVKQAITQGMENQLSKAFEKRRGIDIIAAFRGGIAQLGERRNGIAKVSGSIPLTSTTIDRFAVVTKKAVPEVPIV